MNVLSSFRKKMQKRGNSRRTTGATTNEIHQAEERLTTDDADLAHEAPLADARQQQMQTEEGDESNNTQPNNVTEFVPLRMGGDNGRTHKVSEGSARLLVQEGVTLDALERMTSLFYEKAFADQTLDKFIRSHDDPHGARFAKWIHQKVTGSTVWDEDRRHRSRTPVRLAGGHAHVVHDRSSAHVAAWYSPKRPRKEVGRHFALDECRVWMRLHFWALRESGLLERAPHFCDYYVRFIGHFVRVYEATAPPFCRESLRWSADPRNLERYIANGRRMSDVLQLSLEDAEAQLPMEEAQDDEWPYHQTAPRQP